MTTIKQRRITKIVREFAKAQDSYDITGVDLSLSKFFYRASQELFQDLATGDYRIDTSSGRQTLIITNQEILSVAEAFQVGYVLDFTATKYETQWNVDINTLKDKYNQLVDSTQELWEYIRKTGFISDDTTIDLILPQLDDEQLWYRVDGQYKALSLQDFRDLGERLIEAYVEYQKELFELMFRNARENIINTKDNSIKELQGILDALNINVDNFTGTKKAELQKMIDDFKAGLETIEVGNAHSLGGHTADKYQRKEDSELQTSSKIVVGAINELNDDIFDLNEAIDDIVLSKTSSEDTISDLMASRKYSIGDVVEVLGYYSAGDGAGHPRIKKPEGYTGADAVIGADGSIWGIVHSGEINVSWFGVRVNEISDQLQAFQTAINFCSSNKIKLKVNAGDYYTSNTLYIKSFSIIEFEENSCRIIRMNRTNLNNEGEITVLSNVLSDEWVDNVKITGNVELMANGLNTESQLLTENSIGYNFNNTNSSIYEIKTKSFTTLFKAKSIWNCGGRLFGERANKGIVFDPLEAKSLGTSCTSLDFRIGIDFTSRALVLKNVVYSNIKGYLQGGGNSYAWVGGLECSSDINLLGGCRNLNIKLGIECSTAMLLYTENENYATLDIEQENRPLDYFIKVGHRTENIPLDKQAFISTNGFGAITFTNLYLEDRNIDTSLKVLANNTPIIKNENCEIVFNGGRYTIENYNTSDLKKCVRIINNGMYGFGLTNIEYHINGDLIYYYADATLVNGEATFDLSTTGLDIDRIVSVGAYLVQPKAGITNNSNITIDATKTTYNKLVFASVYDTGYTVRCYITAKIKYSQFIVSKMKEEKVYADYVNYRKDLYNYENVDKSDSEMSALLITQLPVLPNSVEIFFKEYNLI